MGGIEPWVGFQVESGWGDFAHLSHMVGSLACMLSEWFLVCMCFLLTKKFEV